MLNQQYCIISVYSKYRYHYAVWNLITTRRELLHYSNLIQHKLNHIILFQFDMWYMMNQQYCIYSIILQLLISVCCMEFNHYKTWITALQSSNTITSLITSFCFIFDNWYMMNHQYYIYSRNSKYWYQYAVWNLITTRRESLHYCNLMQSQA